MTPSCRFLAAAPAFLALAATPSLLATNGMNLEGYGPVATALGGASFAFDNGTAAVINNPATLGLLRESARLDVALGILGPRITATNPAGVAADSQSKAFLMPALGYVERHGNWTYGLGLFGQGGMGCEYKASSWRGLGFNLENRTEVSVGRFIAPVSYKVNDRLHVAATADFVWAGMDLRMAMSGAQFFDLVDPRSQQFGRAAGSLVQGFSQVLGTLPAGTGVDYAYFDFSNGNDFTGEARGYGYAGKIGLVYEASDRISVGLTYHTRTKLGDLKAPGNAMSFQLNVPGMGRMPQTLTGDFLVRDFEWPAMAGVGLAFRPTPAWLLVADVRAVFWQDVMENFALRFTASGAATNGPFGGRVLDATLFQRWDNQVVAQFGAAVRTAKNLTLRVGANFASNPIPDKYLNCLFPATIEKHVTAGFSYAVSERNAIDFSATHGFEVAKTNGYGIRVSHAQTNAQLMFSRKF